MTMNKGLLAAKKKREEIKAAGVVVKRLSPVERANNAPASLRLAINGMCWQCAGDGADGEKFTRDTIANCTITVCSLHKVRPYQPRG